MAWRRHGIPSSACCPIQMAKPTALVVLLALVLSSLLLTIPMTNGKTSSKAPGGKEWTPDLFPNPKRDTFLCGRAGRVSSICDVDGVLSDTIKNRLEGLIDDIQHGESPYRLAQCGSVGSEGYEVAVAVMQKMRVDPGKQPAEVAKKFAKTLHARWGVGNSACDNGVLVLLSTDDRQVYVSTGSQSQREGLSDGTLSLVVSWIVPYLKQGAYGEAMIRVVTNIGLALSGWDVAQDESTWSIGLVFFLIVLTFMLFSIALSVCQTRKRNTRLKTCKQVLEKIKDEQDKVVSREWSEHRTCPVCFEAFGESSGETLTSTVGVDDATEEGSRLLGAPDRKRLVLKCGHSVCEPCLKEWMARNRTCPICRESVDNDDGDAGTVDDGMATGTVGARSLANDVLTADLLYRLQRTQRMYPEFITDDVVRGWHQSGQDTGSFRMDRWVTDQVVAARQTTRGIHGSSSASFGGGRGGGGGAGASW